ncbi:MAG TPA: ABC transporter permease [Bryobacterales bacterium]|nr:ABC transporter permease [Bryobacterales bacterium]
MSFLASVGRGSIERAEYIGGLTIQFYRGVAAAWRVNPLRGNRQRWRSTLKHMAVVGVDALPVVCLIAACTGLIMALQGGAELRRFGAMQFVINLVAVSMTRELGPLITAIVVVGRSGSAFSAEIGTMVVTEEVDALRSMALDPIEFLLAPKFIAMMVMLPCLTIAANAAGILAGGIFIYFSLDMGLQLYLRAALDALVLRDVISGLIKSIAFGTIIVHVGCYEGFHVAGGPEGVGRSTTAAVVKSIFLVVLADLLFTGFFYFFWP